MGPGEMGIVFLLGAALAAATWASRDARGRTEQVWIPRLVAAAVLLTFPIGPALYARLRHGLGTSPVVASVEE